MAASHEEEKVRQRDNSFFYFFYLSGNFGCYIIYMAVIKRLDKLLSNVAESNIFVTELVDFAGTEKRWGCRCIHDTLAFLKMTD